MSNTSSNSSRNLSFREQGKRIRLAVEPWPYRIVEVINPLTNSINFIKVWLPSPPPRRPQQTWSHSDVDSTDGEVSDGGRTNKKKKKELRRKTARSKMPEPKVVKLVRASYPQTDMRHGGTKTLIALGVLAVTFVVSWKGMGGHHS